MLMRLGESSFSGFSSIIIISIRFTREEVIFCSVIRKGFLAKRLGIQLHWSGHCSYWIEVRFIYSYNKTVRGPILYIEDIINIIIIMRKDIEYFLSRTSVWLS